MLTDFCGMELCRDRICREELCSELFYQNMFDVCYRILIISCSWFTIENDMVMWNAITMVISYRGMRRIL